MAVDSNRIVNLMNADKFFSQPVTKRYMKRVEKERFTLTPQKAKQKLYAKKYAKPSSSDIEFSQRQIEIAVNAMKGKP